MSELDADKLLEILVSLVEIYRARNLEKHSIGRKMGIIHSKTQKPSGPMVSGGGFVWPIRSGTSTVSGTSGGSAVSGTSTVSGSGKDEVTIEIQEENYRTMSRNKRIIGDTEKRLSAMIETDRRLSMMIDEERRLSSLASDAANEKYEIDIPGQVEEAHEAISTNIDLQFTSIVEDILKLRAEMRNDKMMSAAGSTLTASSSIGSLSNNKRYFIQALKISFKLCLMIIGSIIGYALCILILYFSSNSDPLFGSI